jgi:hypothetical protein
VSAPGEAGAIQPVQMRFLVQLSLAFLAGLVLGYALLGMWDVIGAVDLFNARFGQW